MLLVTVAPLRVDLIVGPRHVRIVCLRWRSGGISRTRRICHAWRRRMHVSGPRREAWGWVLAVTCHLFRIKSVVVGVLHWMRNTRREWLKWRRSRQPTTGIQGAIGVAVGRAVVDSTDAIVLVDKGIGTWILRSLDSVFDLEYLGPWWQYQVGIPELGWRICVRYRWRLVIGRTAANSDRLCVVHLAGPRFVWCQRFSILVIVVLLCFFSGNGSGLTGGGSVPSSFDTVSRLSQGRCRRFNRNGSSLTLSATLPLLTCFS